MQERKEIKLVIEINEALGEISELIQIVNKKRYDINNIFIKDDKLYRKKEEIKKMYQKAIDFDKDNYNDLIKTINDLKILNRFLDIYKKEIENQ